ncbi:hypothetical protein M758_7G021800 [Ceratodon purpureus]|nr:hypothetical protein M758_7G021800 [Ceratodon purpureus]
MCLVYLLSLHFVKSQGQAAGGGKAPANNFASSSMSGMSSRTSPLGNKSVAFSKPTNPGESPGGGSLTRMGPESAHRAGGPRLRAEGLMVPPASDAATLRRQVAALQIDLEAHIDGEQRLQSINQQLRERLEVYMKQNHENVERAETELNTLHEDMEQTLELQRRLAQRATALEKEKKEIEGVLQRRVLEFENERTSLQTRIQSMGEDLRAKAEAQEKVNELQEELLSTLDVKAKLEERLEKFAKETAFLKKKADDYSNELRDLILKEQLDQKLDRMGRKAVIRRAFINLQLGVKEQCIDRANTVQARKLYRRHCCKKISYYLRMATQRSSVIRRAHDRHSKNVFHDCWRAWRLSMVARRMGIDSLKKQDTARLFHSMHVWVAYIVRLRENPERYLVAVTHWNRKCLQNYFERWIWTLRAWKLTAKEEKLLMGKAMRHFSKSLMRFSFESWQDWLKTFAVPKRRKFAEVQAHINMMTMKQATAAWRCIVYVKWVRRIKFEEAVEVSKTWCIKRTFSRSSHPYILSIPPLKHVIDLQLRFFQVLRGFSSILLDDVTPGKGCLKDISFCLTR